MNTVPANEQQQEAEATARHLVLEPSVRNESGALWVHRDYVQAVEAFENEYHIGPVRAYEAFGDVESWAAYIKKYTVKGGQPFITWNSKGLKAVLDYHDAINPGRAAWVARAPFEWTPEFIDWSRIADDHAVPQKEAVEFLDDNAPDIESPEPAVLLTLLRALRANVTATAETELRADGTSYVRFARNQQVRSEGAELPPELTIAIPVLRGHVDENGVPVRYKLVLKLRASVGDDARLGLRFSMPAAERVMETVYYERVTAARTLLGDSYTILRAQG